MSTVLVTGAGGFIGSNLIPLLVEAFGAVRAGVRRSRPETGEPVPAVACDLDDSAQVRAAVDGVDLVIHAAYGDEAAMPAQARRLLIAMSAAGVKNLIALSSIAVYGARAGDVMEEDGPVGALSTYAGAKAECEALYRAWAAEDAERRVVALRPGIVYGAGSPFWIGKMGERIVSGGWGLFGPRGEGKAALIHNDDLARLVTVVGRELMAADRESLPGFVAVNAVGPETPVWNVYFSELARALGAPPLRLWSAGEIKVRQALAIPAKILRRFRLPAPRAAALAPTPGEMQLFALDATYSSAKAERLFGVKATIGLREGLARCGLADQPNV